MSGEGHGYADYTVDKKVPLLVDPVLFGQSACRWTSIGVPLFMGSSEGC